MFYVLSQVLRFIFLNLPVGFFKSLLSYFNCQELFVSLPTLVFYNFLSLFHGCDLFYFAEYSLLFQKVLPSTSHSCWFFVYLLLVGQLAGWFGFFLKLLEQLAVLRNPLTLQSEALERGLEALCTGIGLVVVKRWASFDGMIWPSQFIRKQLPAAIVSHGSFLFS